MPMFSKYKGGGDWLPAGTMQGISRGTELMAAGMTSGLNQIGAGLGERAKKKKEEEWSESFKNALEDAHANRERYGLAASDKSDQTMALTKELQRLKDANPGVTEEGWTPTVGGVNRDTTDKVNQFWSLHDQLAATDEGKRVMQEGYTPEGEMGQGVHGVGTWKPHTDTKLSLDELGLAREYAARRDELVRSGEGLISPSVGAEELEQWRSFQHLPETESPGITIDGPLPMPPSIPSPADTSGLPDIPSPAAKEGFPAENIGAGPHGFPKEYRKDLTVNDPAAQIEAFNRINSLKERINQNSAESDALMARHEEEMAKPIDMAEVLRNTLKTGTPPDSKVFMDTVREIGRLEDAKSMREYREGLVSDKKEKEENQKRLDNLDVSGLLQSVVPTGKQPNQVFYADAVDGVMDKARELGIEPNLAFRNRVEQRAKQGIPFGGTDAGRAQIKAQIKASIDATKGSKNPVTGQYELDPQSTAQTILENPDLATQFPQLVANAKAEAQKMFPSGVTLETVGANVMMGDPGQRIIREDGKYLGMAAAIPQKGSNIAIPILTESGVKTGKMFWGDKLVDDPEVTAAEKETAKAETLRGREVSILPQMVDAVNDSGKSVKMPKGIGSITGHAASPAEAKDMRERWSAAEEAMVQFDILLAGTDPKGTGWELYGADRAAADSAQAVLIGKLRIALLGPGQMTDTEAERIKTAIPNPREYGRLRDSTRAALLQTRASMLQAIKSRAVAQGLTFTEGTKFDARGAGKIFTDEEVANGGLPGGPVSGAETNVTPAMMQESNER